ncbi:MAG: diacylglycerol kinase family protein [Opitutaceae bacterium]
MHASVILNAAAGTTAQAEADSILPAVKAALTAAGIEGPVEVVPPTDFIRRLTTLVATHPETVIVGGGDGTIRSAAEILAGTGIRLGVLPLGTLNHFAKDLGLPADWRQAIPALANASDAEVDLGEVNDRVFLNNCSIGAYAETVRRRDVLRRRESLGKWRAMFHAGLETFRRFPNFRLRIERDGVTRFVLTPLLVVGNNRYSGHVLDSSLRPRLDEGRLFIYSAHVHRHLAFLRLALQALIRGLDGAEALDTADATAFTIASESGKLPVALDGEAMEFRDPLVFRIRPKSLRVLLPLNPK